MSLHSTHQLSCPYYTCLSSSLRIYPHSMFINEANWKHTVEGRNINEIKLHSLYFNSVWEAGSKPLCRAFMWSYMIKIILSMEISKPGFELAVIIICRWVVCDDQTLQTEKNTDQLPTYSVFVLTYIDWEAESKWCRWSVQNSEKLNIII